MSLTGLLILLVVAAIAGSIGQALSGYSLGGCIISIIVGYVGAFIGMWIAQQFGFPTILPITVGGETFPIVWSIIGSAILSAILGLLSRRRRLV
ncbi:MAG TPA: GlsB/YeaQ/YmgE family stress response membrane protein [Anaerolineales bacterium]|nr:GlsB/YeaQ/YmgE family stress response membrane protein [Anaerolineales bacterium]